MSDEVAVNKLLAVCCCVKKRNTPEFMTSFAEVINAALAARGSDDRVEWPAAWSDEFYLVPGNWSKVEGK